jgi:hypothetical protein
MAYEGTGNIKVKCKFQPEFPCFYTMIRTKAKLAPFMLSLSKHERDESSISPPSTMLRPGFDRLSVNGTQPSFVLPYSIITVCPVFGIPW